MSDSPPPPKVRVVLVLSDEGDPRRRRGEHERDWVIRMRALLKDALRIYGFRCKVLRDPTPAQSAASEGPGVQCRQCGITSAAGGGRCPVCGAAGEPTEGQSCQGD